MCWIAVFELAHVARPIVGQHGLQRFLRERVSLAVAFKKCAISAGMSSLRSRSGAKRMFTTLSR